MGPPSPTPHPELRIYTFAVAEICEGVYRELDGPAVAWCLPKILFGFRGGAPNTHTPLYPISQQRCFLLPLMVVFELERVLSDKMKCLLEKEEWDRLLGQLLARVALRVLCCVALRAPSVTTAPRKTQAGAPYWKVQFCNQWYCTAFKL